MNRNNYMDTMGPQQSQIFAQLGVAVKSISVEQAEMAGKKIAEAAARLVDTRNEIDHLHNQLAKAQAQEQELVLALREGVNTVQTLLPLDAIPNALIHGGQEFVKVDR